MNEFKYLPQLLLSGAAAGIFIAATGLPVWLVFPVGFIIAILYVAEMATREEKKQKREDTLALAMHEKEVAMRIEAEQKQAEQNKSKS